MKRILMLAAFALAISFFAVAAKPGTSTTTPVTSYIASVDGSGAMYRIGGDDPILGSGDVYKTFKVSRTDHATSQLNGSGDWDLVTLSSTTRKFWIALDDPLPGSPVDPLGPAKYVGGDFQTLCSNNGDTEALKGMTVGQSKLIPLILSFNLNDTNNLDYRVAFNPFQQSGSDRLLAVCVGADASGCNRWTIDPPGGAGTKAVGRLLKLEKSKNGSLTKVPLGDYFMTLHFDISRP